MNKEEKKVVPQLRFPEFDNDREWQEKELEQVCNIHNNRRKPISSSKREKGIYPYYGASGIIDYVKDYIFDERLLLIGEDGAKWGAFENTAFIVEGKYWVNNHAHVLEPTLIDDKLLENYLVKIDIHPFITGAAPPKLTLNNLKKIPVPVPPSLKEQQKIANCLSSLENIITAESEKLDLLKDHKKGLLQQLFPAEGKMQPKYRFPEFKNDGDWVGTTLDDAADYENGKAHEKEISETGKYKVVNSKFISTNGEVVKFTNSANLKATVGDILMVLSDIPNGKAIAKCFYVDKEDTYTVNQRICKITPTDIHNKFLFYVQNRNKYFLAFDDGVKQTNLRKDTVLSFPFLKPKDPKEQEKIAECLSLSDDLIKEQANKIVFLQEHKKGLLQQLFPNIND